MHRDDDNIRKARALLRQISDWYRVGCPIPEKPLFGSGYDGLVENFQRCISPTHGLGFSKLRYELVFEDCDQEGAKAEFEATVAAAVEREFDERILNECQDLEKLKTLKLQLIKAEQYCKPGYYKQRYERLSSAFLSIAKELYQRLLAKDDISNTPNEIKKDIEECLREGNLDVSAIDHTDLKGKRNAGAILYNSAVIASLRCAKSPSDSTLSKSQRIQYIRGMLSDAGIRVKIPVKDLDTVIKTQLTNTA